MGAVGRGVLSAALCSLQYFATARRNSMLWVTIGCAPGLFLYVYLGTLGQLGLNLARGKTHPRLVEYWTWGGAFAISALLLIVLSRMASRTVRRSRQVDSAGQTEKA